MVNFTRRALLVRGLWGVVLATLSSSCAFLKPRATLDSSEEMESRLSGTDIETIRICLDLLIPEDQTPSATALGVDIHLLDEAAANPQIKAILHQGVLWLTLKALDKGTDAFPYLVETEQIALINLTESAEPDSIEQVFFSHLRNRAFYYYYANPLAFNFSGYSSSPQPKGYPGYFKPTEEES